MTFPAYTHGLIYMPDLVFFGVLESLKRHVAKDTSAPVTVGRASLLEQNRLSEGRLSGRGSLMREVTADTHSHFIK
jgi:hypothetical protein